jgi:hypothetical protein
VTGENAREVGFLRSARKKSGENVGAPTFKVLLEGQKVDIVLVLLWRITGANSHSAALPRGRLKHTA